MNREIWFYRIWLAYYLPCHWKGVAVLVGLISFIGVGAFGGQALLDALGFHDADWIAFPLFFLAGFVPLIVIAHRHS